MHFSNIVKGEGDNYSVQCFNSFGADCSTLAFSAKRLNTSCVPVVFALCDSNRWVFFQLSRSVRCAVYTGSAREIECGPLNVLTTRPPGCNVTGVLMSTTGTSL